MDILSLFQYNQKLKFSDIEKALNVRSNKLSYHLKNLTKNNILKKEENYYSLSESSEHLIPYLSEKKAVLPVILILIGNKKNCFLYKRDKRPFKNQLSLPVGRPLMGESIKQATSRIMKEKFNINAKLTQIHSVSIEKLIRSNKIIQTDIVVFVSASTKGIMKFTDVDKNKRHIITSDYKFIKEDLNKKINIKTIITTKF